MMPAKGKQRLVWTFLILHALQGFSPVFAQSNQEYRIKAAFIYNFAQFVDWPQDNNLHSDAFVIGVLGDDPFGDALDTLQDESVRNRRIVIKRFASAEDIHNNCDLLFISRSEIENLDRIQSFLKDQKVLTVGETSHFTERGGDIAFIIKENKVRFIINRLSTERQGLHINAQLLTLADRVLS